jgi:PTS system N-acetylglucosamine-specific IIC component
MYRAALPEQRKAVSGMLASMALTSFLTGITEPIEFTFMFLAPVLYGVHALLTGLAMVLMDVLGVRLGFGFSAGLFDYVLNYGLATRPLWLLPVGALYFGIYYGVFRVCITAFNLQTPGRESGEGEVGAPLISASADERVVAFVTALGGVRNLTSVDACATRLRLVVVSQNAIDEPALKRLGAIATVKVSTDALQVILGPIADQVAGEIRAHLHAQPKGGAASAAAAAKTPSPARAVARDEASLAPEVISGLLAALGGRENVREVEAVAGSRLRVRVASAAAVDDGAVRSLGLRGIARPAPDRVHVLIGPAAAQTLISLRALLAR